MLHKLSIFTAISLLAGFANSQSTHPGQVCPPNSLGIKLLFLDETDSTAPIQVHIVGENCETFAFQTLTAEQTAFPTPLEAVCNTDFPAGFQITCPKDSNGNLLPNVSPTIVSTPADNGVAQTFGTIVTIPDQPPQCADPNNPDFPTGPLLRCLAQA